MLAFLGFVFSLIIGIKLALFLLHLLLAKYGRNMGIGAKWTSDKGEYAVIVGASGAIGSEYAREFASMGFNLLLISRNNDKLKKLSQEFKEKYQTKEVKLVPVDFSHPESVETVKSAVNSVGQIVALVNCMGISYPPKKFAEYPHGFNSDLINVSVVAPVLMIEMVLPKMLEKNRGTIINYSSMSGRFKFPFFSTFSATKSFLSTLSDILSVEYSSQGITVQNVEPLFVQSHMTDLKPSFMVILPSIAVFSSLREAGLEPTTYGFWIHKLIALALHILVFLLGSRLTTKLIGCFMLQFCGAPDAKSSKADEDKKASETGKTEESDSSKTPKLAESEGGTPVKIIPGDASKDVPKQPMIKIDQDSRSVGHKPQGNPPGLPPSLPRGMDSGPKNEGSSSNKAKFGSSIGSHNTGSSLGEAGSPSTQSAPSSISSGSSASSAFGNKPKQ